MTEARQRLGYATRIIREEHAALWSDMAAAVRDTSARCRIPDEPDRWSIGMRDTATRIQRHARYLGGCNWRVIEIPFLRAGWYDAICRHIGVTPDPWPRDDPALLAYNDGQIPDYYLAYDPVEPGWPPPPVVHDAAGNTYVPAMSGLDATWRALGQAGPAPGEP